MDDLDTVIEEARRETERSPRGFMASVISRLGATANVAAVFGEPVERDGVTIIPVARASWLAIGGGGTGTKDDGEESGEGGGGIARATARPVGFIRVSGGQAEFVAISDPSSVVPLILAGGVTAYLVLRGLRRLLR